MELPQQRIYLAGPIQHVNDYGKGWREWLKNNHTAFEWADPMEKYNTMQEAEAEWSVTDIVEEDLAMIDDSDGLLAHWEAVPTAGTPMEIFYTARYTDKPVVIQTTLHDDDISPWITYHADAIVDDFDSAIAELQAELAEATV
jgi:nucleoside 2-deoxyribosyltransferase